MITASSFHSVSRLKNTTNPDKSIHFLMEGDTFDVVPAPLQWSCKKEIAAKTLFLKSHKAEHGQCKSFEQELLINMGACPDV